MVSIPQALVRSPTNLQLTIQATSVPTLHTSSKTVHTSSPTLIRLALQFPRRLIFVLKPSGTARSCRPELRSWSESRAMTRHSNRKLHALYMSRRFRVPSPADGPGFLYAFVDSGVYWKLGMTIDYDRRKAEWDRQCPCPGRVWLPPMQVLRRRKSGSKAHIEIFFIPGHWFVVWETIVLPVLARVVAACVILKGKLAKMNDIRNTFPSGYLGYRGVLMSQRPDIETSQCPKVPISTTSRCPDVPTSCTPILGEIILKNLMLSTRRIFRENFKLSRVD
ncbi:hypothetical protein EV368DRAFT_66378 [Lentinula lateritia]|nr:hypothetical protein EV368DRAFT_66378 [Lentinula lateritia]